MELVRAEVDDAILLRRFWGEGELPLVMAIVRALGVGLGS